MTPSPPSPAAPRVLFVNRMAALERGGGETFDLEMARALAARGLSVSFLTSAPLFRPAPCPLPPAFRPVRLRNPWLRRFPWDKVRGGWRLRDAEFTLFEWRAARWILRHAAAFDLVQICELPNLVRFLKRARCPLPLSLRLTAPNYYDPRGGLPLADLLIASGTSIEALRARGFPDIRDIPNGVDTDRFRPGTNPAFRADRGIPPDAFVTLYAARFQAFKNHALLLDAFALLHRDLPTARLLLAGSGPLLPRAKKQAETLGISKNVLFLGDVPHDDLPAICRAADLCAITSDYESFCFSAIEAMATGLPVLSTDCGWVPRLVSGGYGEVVPRPAPGAPTDPAAYAAAWRRLARDPETRRAMGAAARAKTLANYTWTASAARLHALYLSLLQKSSATRP